MMNSDDAAMGRVCLAVTAFAQDEARVSNAAYRGAGIAPGSVVSIGAREREPRALESVVTFSSVRTGRTEAARTLQSPQCCYDIWAIVPEGMPPGDTIVRVEIPGEPPKSGHIEIVPIAPALLTANHWGYGPAIAQNYVASFVDTIRLTNPALPGQFVSLYGTGLGNATAADVTIDLAGTIIPATYAGRQRHLGADQINFRMPENPHFGCYVPLTLRVRGIVSNTVTLMVSQTPGACAHPLGLSWDALRMLDAGGTVRIGSLDIGARLLDAPGVVLFSGFFGAAAYASFVDADADYVFLVAQIQIPERQYFSCGLEGNEIAFLWIGPPTLYAGRVLTLTTPEGKTAQSSDFLRYQWFSDDLQITPGPWLWTVPGGLDIRGFQQPFTVPPGVRLTNRESLASISRNADAVITWNPQGYGSGDVLLARLSTPRHEITCRAHAWEGRLAVPRDFLSALEPGDGVLSLAITAYPASRVRFDVPLTSGGTAPAIINYGLFEHLEVKLR